jgi:hypothetical protein
MIEGATVSVTDPYGRILGFADRLRHSIFQIMQFNTSLGNQNIRLISEANATNNSSIFTFTLPLLKEQGEKG